jgi:hypothetical protein
MPGSPGPAAELCAVPPSSTAAIGWSGDAPTSSARGGGGREPNACPSVIQGGGSPWNAAKRP